MADATGTPTSLGIPTFNVDVDAPSGLGFNAAMAEIDTLLQQRVLSPAGISAGDVPVWNGTTWVKPTGTRDGTKFLRDDGSWQLPGGAMVLLGSDVLGASAAALDVTGIPSTYSHLKIIIAAQSDGAGGASTGTFVQFNGDTGTTYGHQNIRFNNNALSDSVGGNLASIYLGESPAGTGDHNAWSTIDFTIANYAKAGRYKVLTGSSTAIPSFTGATNFWANLISGMWTGLTAIDHVHIFMGSGNFTAGSSLHVYGIL